MASCADEFDGCGAVAVDGTRRQFRSKLDHTRQERSLRRCGVMPSASAADPLPLLHTGGPGAAGMTLRADELDGCLVVAVDGTRRQFRSKLEHTRQERLSLIHI